VVHEAVTIADGVARMLVNGREVASAPLDQARRLYVVRFADSLFHGDEPFFVLVFNDRLWVLPDLVEGLHDLLTPVVRRLAASDGLYRAEMPPRPYAWRRKIAGLLPLFPTPRLAQHALTTMPQWREEGPSQQTDLPELAGEMA